MLYLEINQDYQSSYRYVQKVVSMPNFLVYFIISKISFNLLVFHFSPMMAIYLISIFANSLTYIFNFNE